MVTLNFCFKCVSITVNCQQQFIMDTTAILLKAEFSGTKIKFKVRDPNLTIHHLKEQICDVFAESGVILDKNHIDLLSDDDFRLSNVDTIKDLLKSGDTLKVLQKLADEVKQMQQQSAPTEQVQQQVQPLQHVQEDPVEAIVVLYDISGSMACGYFNDPEINRIGAVNAFFSAFADKTLAFECNHLVKLVCFNEQTQDKCDFMNDFEKFIQLVDGQTAQGGTRCYDSILYAVTKLLEIKQKYPNILLRIIALTDGEDTSSTNKPQQIVKQIIENQIIMDSFVVGENCVGLKTLTHASGGRCYCPKQLAQGLALFEIETIISALRRDKSTRAETQTGLPEVDLKTLESRPFDTDGLPAAKDESQSKKAMTAEELKKQIEKVQSAPADAGQKSQSQKRILKELKDINDPTQGYPFKAFPIDLISWRIVLLGPKTSVFKDGRYIFTCNFPQNFPFSAPKLKLANKIYHPNFSQTGQTCFDLLSNNWSPAVSMSVLLCGIHTLMGKPDADSAIDSTIASMYKMDLEQFNKNAIEQVKAYASYTFDELTKQALGEGVDETSDEFKQTRAEIEEWITKYYA